MNTMAATKMSKTAAAPMAIPAMAPALSAAAGLDVGALVAAEEVDVLVAEVEGDVDEEPVAVELWDDGTADATPLAVRLT